MTRRRRALIGLALIVTVLPAGTAGAAGTIQVRDAGTATFPKRSYVVTLPERRALKASDVRVTENGQPVHEIRLERGNASAMGVVLAIDASNSMHGRAIEDAMAAAREFARRRRPEQKLGVVFFSREATVALEPTTDAARIDDVLASPPELTKGTQIYDATKVAIDQIDQAGVGVGSVIVLSDGADVGSTLDGRGVAAAAQAGKVTIHSVGLRSSLSFDPGALEAIPTNGGRYIESTTSKGLSAVFARLGDQIGNEYVVSWTSPAPVGSRVGVGIEVDGYPGLAAAAYQVPDLAARPAVASEAKESFWRSTAAAILVAGVVAILVGFAIILVARGRRRTIGERISTFVFERERVLPHFEREGPSLLDVIETRLDGRKRWDAFKLDVEIAGLKLSAIRIALIGLGVGFAVAAIALLLDRVPIALLALVGVPLVLRFAVKRRADKVRKRFGEQLPDNLQVMASALRAGHSFVGALKTMVNDAPEPSRGEYQRVLHDEQMGVPIEDSMKVVGQRMKNEEVEYVGLVATLQRETGGNTAEVLDRIVITIRERMKLRRLISTLTAQGRLGGWIVTALPIAMVIFLNIAKPDYMDPMLETTMGWVVLIAGAIMVALGAFVIRKIVDIQV